MTRWEYRTPGTALWWSDVASWCAAARRLAARRCSARRSAALEAHAAALPLSMIAAETDAAAIADALDLLKHGPPCLARPPRGARAGAPQTPRIVALANRAARLARDADALPTGGNWIAVHGDAEKPHGVRKP
jgi:hypothetical protein